MKKKTIAALAAGGIAGLSALGMEGFYRFAFSGEFHLPESLMMNEEQFEHLNENRKKFADLPQEEVTVLSGDGLKLTGHLIRAQHPVRNIIMVHGWRSSWDLDATGFAFWQLARGSNLLLIEQRAQGKSEGKWMTFGIKEAEDVLIWADWMIKRDANLPLYLFGTSMGAVSVLLTASENFPSQVKGIIADSAYTSPYDVMVYFGRKRFHLPEYPFVALLNLICRLRMGTDLRNVSTEKALRANAAKDHPTPVLLIQGTRDGFVDWHMALKNKAAAGQTAQLRLYEGVGHVSSFKHCTEDYKDAVDKFFSSAEKER